MKIHAKKYSYIAVWIVILTLGTSSSAWAKKMNSVKSFSLATAYLILAMFTLSLERYPHHLTR
jgi:hypothetical protein